MTPGRAGAILALPNGGVLVGGSSGTVAALVRYLPNGQLDLGFGTRGIATFPSIPNSAVAGLALHPNGDYVMAGNVTWPATNWCVKRELFVAWVRPDGSFDPASPRKTTGFSGAGPDGRLCDFVPGFADLALDGDGNALVLYQSIPSPFIYSQHSTVSVVRFRTGPGVTHDSTLGAVGPNAGGVLRFGNVPPVVDGSDERAPSGRLVVLPNGDLIIAANRYTAGTGGKFAPTVFRARISGYLATSFGIAGEVKDPLGPGDWSAVRSMFLDAQGRVVLAGFVRTGTGAPDHAVARFTVDGQPDTSLDTDGRALLDVGGEDDWCAFAFTDGGGRLGLVGTTASGAFPWASGFRSHVSLTRLTATGAFEPTFGTRGRVTWSRFPRGTQAWFGTATGDGVFVVTSEAGSEPDFTVAKLRWP